ncbi:hypothetical protein GCM10010112_61600 [Actinoplanes lobatus]|uniref:Uncharacterized protein n=1 Tax=Actinoplanes lobatus TaxID=113568 RepID=A0ABQ4ANC4_9ACTN|nr:hypothetical protein GCM10010112_61600 [Actinoplanes lobatus]GIE42350.1 hypothetical protein Alo02nite_52480 [Actinoplanes lobatus]
MASWIWVTDWKSETAKPTTRAVRSTGAAIFAAIVRACIASSTTIVSVMPISSGAGGERGVRDGGRSGAVRLTPQVGPVPVAPIVGP